MPTFDREATQQQVMDRIDEAQRQRQRGDIAAAIASFQEAAELVRSAAAAEPEDPVHYQQLGATLYQLAEWELASGDFSSALRTLNEAALSYERAGADARALIADVIIRRARVHVASRHPLSALADAQEAVTTALSWASNDPREPETVAAARIVALAADVQLGLGGDPELAVGAADWALRVFMAAFRSGQELRAPSTYLSAIQTAGRVAYIVHRATGHEAAEMAGWFANFHRDEPFEPDAFIERVKTAQPTLRRALERLGRTDLALRLTARPDEGPVLVPSMRCESEGAPPLAAQLCLLRAGASEQDKRLLGLEAHALFAAASRMQPPSMRYQFGEFGRHWADAVTEQGQEAEASGEMSAALDAANWVGAIIDQLFPQTIVDADARRVALDGTRWRQQLYIKVGDVAAAEQAARVAATFER